MPEMRPLNTMILVGALGLVLAVGAASAQTPPPAGQPPTQPPATQPPATQPPAAQQPPATPPAPPAPFPEGARVAWVDIQVVASNSVEGKAATAKIQEFNKKKAAELQDKQKALQAMQTKLQQGATVMSDPARSQLEKDIDKANRELQFAQSEAQSEQQQLTNDLQNDFQQKLGPAIEAVAKEKGLHMVFSIRDSGAIWAQPGLDISAEVIKRFDAMAKTPAKK
jgi:outer membrane protein